MLRLTGLLTTVAPAAVEPQMFRVAGDIEGVHDPVIAREVSTYYVSSTIRGPQGNIPILWSEDLANRRLCGAVFETLPERTTRELPGARSSWAADHVSTVVWERGWPRVTMLPGEPLVPASGGTQ